MASSMRHLQFTFVLQHKNAPNTLKIAFEFPLQVTLVQCYESNMAFCQQFYFLDRSPLEMDASIG